VILFHRPLPLARQDDALAHGMFDRSSVRKQLRPAWLTPCKYWTRRIRFSTAFGQPVDIFVNKKRGKMRKLPTRNLRDQRRPIWRSGINSYLSVACSIFLCRNFKKSCKCLIVKSRPKLVH